MYEYNPWADLLPDFTADLVDAPALALRPIGGASPGIFDEVGGFVGGAIANEFWPVVDAVGGQLDDLVRRVWGVVQTGFSLVLRMAVKRELGIINALIPPYWNIVYSQRLASPSVTAGDLFATLLEALLQALWTVMNAVAAWVRDRIGELLGAAGRGFATMADWVERVVFVWVGWLRDRVSDLLGAAGRGFANLGDWVERVVTVWVSWVRDRVSDLLGALGRGVATVADWVERVAVVWFGWIRDRLVDFLGAVAHGVGTLADWVVKVAQDWFPWVRDRIVDALGFVGKGFGSFADFVISQLQGLGKWIWDSIATPIFDELKKVAGYVISGAQDIGGFLIDALKAVFLGPIEAIAAVVDAKLAIPGKLVRGEYTSLIQLVEDLMDPPPEVMGGFTGALIMPFVIAGAVHAMITHLSVPLVEPIVQEQRKGVGAELLTMTMLQDARDRDLINDVTYVDTLRRMGYGTEFLNVINTLRARIPSASDLMRMADKRVWSLQVPEKYGQYAELPGQVVDYMQNIGFTQEWTRNYWRAHWELPSPQQVFEMLHRGFISEDDITQYLGLTDWLPFFRDHLLNISYNPLTRVDLRRVYKLGVIDEAQVNRGYRDLGYNAENADRLTQFTVRYYGSAQKTKLDEITDLSSSTIRQAYRRHVIDREAALGFLEGQGEAADVADFLLSLDDAQLAVHPLGDAGVPIKDESVGIIRQAYREGLYAYDEAVTHLEVIGVLGAEADVMLALDDITVARDLKKAQTALVRERYIGHYVDAAGARNQLAGAGVPARQHDILIAEWDVERQKGSRRLTVAEIFKALAANLITGDDARGRLAVLGYTEADANIIFDLRGAA